MAFAPMEGRATPLLAGEPIDRQERQDCATPPAPLCESPARWAILASVAMMPVGIHMCYTMTTGLQTHLMNDAFQPPISAEKYGILNSAVSWFNLVAPFRAGLLVDRQGSQVVGILAATIGLLGQLLFALGVHSHIFSIAVFGRCVFGIGEGAVLVAQGAAIATWFRGAELTFAIAIAEMFHSIANWSGKAVVVLGTELGGWRVTIWISAFFCVLGILAAFVFARLERRHMKRIGRDLKMADPTFLDSITKLSTSFWILILIHLTVSNCEHLFDTISTNFIQEKWHHSTSQAASIASLYYVFPIVLCPLVGLLIDKSRWRLTVATCACLVMGSAHLMLGLTHVTPVLGVLALSIPQAVMPTILRSSAVLVVSPTIMGMAFGVFGFAESLGKTVGAPLVGYVNDEDGNYTNIELGFAAMSFFASGLVVLLSCRDIRNGGILHAAHSELDLHTIKLQGACEESPTAKARHGPSPWSAE